LIANENIPIGLSSTPDPIMKVRGLFKSFGEQKVIDNLNLDVDRGKITVIIGRSGGGKSVLLKHLIGLMKPDAGQVLVNGIDMATVEGEQLREQLKNFGMLFQNAALFDSMTVEENVAFPLLESTKIRGEELKQTVRETLAKVGLQNIENKIPSELSGGMRKRVGLARALILKPSIILYDEPTTGLDPIMTDIIDTLIYETNRKFNLTSIMISHDIKATFTVADKIAMLYEGQIIAYGTPDEIRQNDNPILRQFIEGKAEGPIKMI
jgi:phospholipid/cholesterol/gamma-HCH transport system ATP-binding protein